jgi:lipopolysaccharide export system protein LptA
MRPKTAIAATLCAFALLAGAGARAQDAAGALGGFGASDTPIKIDAANLDVFDAQQKAVYSGDVVVVQGESTLRCSRLTVFYAPRGEGQAAGTQLRRVECDGPLSAVSGTSTVTGDAGVFEASKQLVTVTGNVILTDCGNVQRGSKLEYDMRTRVVKVTGKRVQGIFDQNAGGGQGGQAGCR